MSSRTVTISLAQAPVIDGDIQQNIVSHLALIEASAEAGADAVVFPELSLSGYALERLGELAMSQDAPEFQVLSQASIQHDIIVIAGCPLVTEANKPAIAAVICFPNGDIRFYQKQYFHEGESQYCLPGTEDCLISIGDYRIALGICADFTELQHAQRAAQKGADLYISSALISEAGYPVDENILSGIAAEHSMPVLLCNHISETGGWATWGRNAVWDASGERVLSSGHQDSGLMLCCFENERITGRFLHVK